MRTIAILLVLAVAFAQADTQKWVVDLPAAVATSSSGQYALNDKTLFVIVNTTVQAINRLTGKITWTSASIYPQGYDQYESPMLAASNGAVAVYCQQNIMLLDVGYGFSNAVINVTRTPTDLLFFGGNIVMVGQEGYTAYDTYGNKQYERFNENNYISCAVISGSHMVMIVSGAQNDMWILNQDGYVTITVPNVTSTTCTGANNGKMTVLVSNNQDGNDIALVDMINGRIVWKKQTTYPVSTVWTFTDVVYAFSNYDQTIKALDITSGEVFQTTSVPNSVDKVSPSAFKFEEKILFTLESQQGAANFTVIDPATGNILEGFTAPTLSAYQIYSMPSSFLVPNMQGLTRFDKATLKVVFRTLDLNGMVAALPAGGGGDDYIAIFGKHIAYFTATQ